MKKYFKHKIKSFLLVNKIVVIHYLEPKGDFFHQEESHNFWEVVFAYKKSVVCSADGKKIKLEEGNMIFHKPNERHSLAVSDKGAAVFVLSFECLSPAMRFFCDKTIKLNARQINFVREIIEIAKRTYDITFCDLDVDIMNLLKNPTLGGEQLIKNYVEMLLIDVMRSMTETVDGNDVFLPETKINDKLSEDIIKLFNENIFNNLTVDDVSKAVSYSKPYIFRQFKKSTGKSVMEYYLDLKIKKAKQLLQDRRLSIKEISEKLHFDTPNYFSKTFKKITGLTPTEYKKRASD